MTKISKRIATITTICTILLLPAGAFARGGGHFGGAHFAPSAPKKTTATKVNGLDKWTQRTCRWRNVPASGCTPVGSPPPIVRDHRSPR